MSCYHVDLDTRVDHTLEPEELENLLDGLHPYGAALSGGLDERLGVSMTITTTGHGPQDASTALEQALQVLQDLVQVVVVDQAHVSTEQAKDAQLAQDTRTLPRVVTVPEIADLLGISRQGARKVLQTDPAAPAVALSTPLGDLYRHNDVEAWAATRGSPRPGRRTQEDLAREATQRARATMDRARDEVRRRSHDGTARQEPLTLRIHTEHLDPDMMEEIATTSTTVNTTSRRHGVAISVIHNS